MKLEFTYVCLGQIGDVGDHCHEVFELAPLGICPVCGSGHVFPLHQLVLSASERAEWYERIAGKKEKGGMSRKHEGPGCKAGPSCGKETRSEESLPE